VPRAILGSLAICTALYVAVSLVVVGMQNYAELDTMRRWLRRFRRSGSR
jgi:APA family basic amino acid/polyamine antiporter